jgi:hypothetical protein
MHVRQWSYDSNSGPSTIQPKHEALTDSAGNFEWIGTFGDSLELESITKDGYRLSAKAPLAFVYNRSDDSFQSSAADPVIIRMWKLVGAENLLSFQTLFGFVPDGRAYTLDLLANKKVEGEHTDGDLLIKVTRPRKLEPHQKYDWVVEISGINGGLCEANDEFGFVAPESGYRPSASFRVKESDAEWSDSLTKDFFIRCRGGTVYGFLHLRIRAEYDGQSAIFFETRLNPGGSRNLQS